MNICLRLVAAAVACTLCVNAHADAPAVEPVEDELGWDEPGHGLRAISIGYELVEVDGAFFRDTYIGGDLAGRTRSESLVLGIDYGINERWSLSASLPYVRRRYDGPFPHNPAILDPPNNTAPALDNGKYHGNLQDYRFGVHYLREFGGFTVSPYLIAHLPSHDYPHFGNAAVGQNLWKLQGGANVSYLFESLPLYVALDLSYTRVEETLGQNVDHWIADVSVGYVIASSVALSVFMTEKDGNGSSFFPSRSDERYYQHDRMQPLLYRSGGASVEWAIGESYGLAATWSTMLDGYTVQNIDYALNVTLTRYFD